MVPGLFRLKIGLTFTVAFISLLWLGVLSLRALDRYVVEPGTIADGNGGIYTNWITAATQIQWAVNASTNASDTIWVSNGTYVLTNQINVTSNIVLRSANGPEVTIVNGGFVENAAVPTNNRCLFLSNISAFVSGFTFSNGACDTNGGGGVWIGAGTLSNSTVCNNKSFVPTNFVSLGGGGIFIRPAGTVIACQVTANNVSNTAGNSSYGSGGGIMAYGAGCEVYGCVVSNNNITGYAISRGGGGIYAYIGPRIRSSLICNNMIYSNTTIEGLGGGVHLYEGNAAMESCTVTVNQALTGGGVYMNRATVTNCLVLNNYARDNGGGFCMYAGNFGYVNYVFNTTIIGNSNMGVVMTTDNRGGTNQMANCTVETNVSLGIYISGNATTAVNIVSNCAVRGNKGGGIHCNILKSAQFRNCLIANNTNSGTYAGLRIASGCGTVAVSSCTIVSNISTNYGAGLRIETTNGGIFVSSCIIYSNGVGGTNDVYDLWAPTNYNALQYSCVGTNAGFTGAVIIATNPQFANFAGGNFHLAGNSPCINAGSNESWMTNALDLDKRARIRYGTVDMGAYETIQDATIYRFR